MRERVRVAVETVMAAIQHLDAEELLDAVEEIERRMLALSDQRAAGTEPKEGTTP